MKRRKPIISKTVAPWVFIAPTVVIFALFMLYPMVDSLILSISSSDPLKPGIVGLENYALIFKDEIFWKALRNTAVYLMVQVPIMVVISVLLASVINLAYVRLKSFFRMSLFLPAITALVAYAMVVKLLFNTEFGLANYLLSLLNISAIPWQTHPFFSKVLIIISVTWRWTGYNMVIIMAGFSNISESIYESAEIDGANFFQKLFRITIPVLKPVILFVVITSTIGTLQLFDESLILTNGGPDNATITIGHYLYNVGFRYFKFEYAAALSYILVIIIGILSLIEAKVAGEEN